MSKKPSKEFLELLKEHMSPSEGAEILKRQFGIESDSISAADMIRAQEINSYRAQRDSLRRVG
jgi:hypothetical protein